MMRVRSARFYRDSEQGVGVICHVFSLHLPVFIFACEPPAHREPAALCVGAFRAEAVAAHGRCHDFGVVQNTPRSRRRLCGARKSLRCLMSRRSPKIALEPPSRASCGCLWGESLKTVLSSLSEVARVTRACTRPTYLLKPLSSTRKLKPRTHGHKAEITSPRWSAARNERAPAPGDGIEAEKGIGP